MGEMDAGRNPFRLCKKLKGHVHTAQQPDSPKLLLDLTAARERNQTRQREEKLLRPKLCSRSAMASVRQPGWSEDALSPASRRPQFLRNKGQRLVTFVLVTLLPFRCYVVCVGELWP